MPTLALSETVPEPLARTAADSRAFRTALGSFATGVTVITTRTATGQPVGLTVNSFASVSLDPPLVLWSLSLKSSSLAVFEQSDHFAVNVLGRHQEELARHFARSSVDKFAGQPFHTGLGGVPLLPDVSAVFQCRKVNRHAGGDHVIFIGEVEAFHHNDHAPLLFSKGAFGGFAAENAPA